MNAYNRFSLILLLLLSVNLLAIAGLNLSVDPYGVLGTPRLTRWNQAKPERNKHFRLAKAVDVIAIQPKTVILGTSTTLRLNPNHSAFQAQPVYNLALAGASIYEVRRYFEHALVNQPDLQQVVIGLDFFSFGDAIAPSKDFSETRLERTHLISQDWLNSVFSIDAIKASFTTVKANLNVTSTAGDNQPEDFIADEPGKTSQNFERVIKSYFQRPDRYKNYQLSQTQLQHFRAIVETCQQRNIQLKVFFPPVHAVQLQAIQEADVWSDFEAWKREIIKITPAWDFSDYNSITTEPMVDGMKNFVDGAHYQYKIADLIVERLYNRTGDRIPADFGLWLTSENLEAHLARIQGQRTNWQNHHPQEVKFVQAIKRQADRE